MAVTIQLPHDVEQKLRQEWSNLEHQILQGFAVEGFRQGKLSSYEVGLILGLNNRQESITFLSEQGVYPNHEMRDLEDDRSTFARLEKEGKMPR